MAARQKKNSPPNSSMPRITKLKAQRNPNYVNIFVDGHFETSLDLVVVTKLGLKVGTDVSGPLLTKLKKESEFAKLFNRALHFLSFRPRSEKEVRDHFQRFWKRVSETPERTKIINELITKLKEKNLLNDHDFAVWWVDQRREFRQKSKRAIASELRRKGIEEEIIQEVLSETSDVENVRLIAEKKVKSLRQENRTKARLKLGNFLGRRGFNWETIRAVVDELLP